MKKKIFIIILLILVIVIVFKLKNNKQDNKEQTNENKDVSNEQQMIEDNNDYSNIVIEEYVKTLEENTVIVESQKLKDERKIGNLIVQDIRIRSKDKDLSMSFGIKNTTSTTQGNKDVTLIAKKKNGEEIGKIALHIDEIPANGTIGYKLKPGYQYINTYDIEILEQQLGIE